MSCLLRHCATFVARWMVGSFAFFGLANLKAESPPHSLSVSRQFVIYGPDVRLRGVVGDLAEETKKDLLGTLRLRDEWKLPIVIDAQLAQANLPEQPASAVTFTQTEAGPKLQVALALRAPVNAFAVQREILRALLVELIYRDHPRVVPGTAYAQAPEWLIEGLLGQPAGKADTNPLQPLAPLAAAKKLAPLSEFLTQRPELLDSSSRAVYRAYSWALVKLLSDGANGAGLLAYIRNLPTAPPDPVVALTAAVPSFVANPEAMWQEGLSRLLMATPMGLLSIAETESALDALLNITLSNRTGGTRAFRLEQFPDFIRQPNAPAALQNASRELLILATRANPVCRPIVLEYQQITSALAHREIRGVGARLSKLKSLRGQLASRAREIDDYLNWFEATQSRTPSGLFTEYMKAAEAAEEARPERRDAISRYLTNLESQLQK